MADFGRWRDDAAGEPAADAVVGADQPGQPDQSERPERGLSADGRLRSRYADDPDDIFATDTDDPEPQAGPGGSSDRDTGGRPGDRPAGEPTPDGPNPGDPTRTGPDEQGSDVDSQRTIVDRPRVPVALDVDYGVDMTPRDGWLIRPPLFDGPPRREQAMQGDLNDCGLIAALGAVAGHRSEAIRDLVSQRPDGGYLVRLHQVEPDGRGVFVPTGERIELGVTPEVPIRGDFPHYAAFADTYKTGVSWAAVLEKAMAGVDDTWSQRWADYRAGTSGYERLDLGSLPWDQAEWLAMLTGRRATAVVLDRTPGHEQTVEEALRTHLAAGNPIVTTTHDGGGYGQLPHDLAPLHVYELVAVERGQVQLHNPWGYQHPEPMSIRDFIDNTQPYIATTSEKETP